jgi:hypothetical protein
MPALPDIQARFALALRGGEAPLAQDMEDDGLGRDRRLQIYRNNSRAMFEGALGRSFPVLRRRVGDEFFSKLAREYRAHHPSRSGDLHWVGMHFPEYLADALAGGDYAWLAELAALEWACECSLVAASRPPVGIESLSLLAPEAIGRACLELQPFLRCASSSFPVLDVWRANQPDGDGEPVDLSKGGQWVLVGCGWAGLELREVPAPTLEFTRRLEDGATLEDALERSGLPADALVGALGLLFAAGLVTGVRPPPECDP